MPLSLSRLLEVLPSLHHDLPGHFRVDRAVVGIRSRLSKRVGELLVRITHLGLEHSIRAHDGMGNIITVNPRNCSSNRYLDRLRAKVEIVDLDLYVCP